MANTKIDPRMFHAETVQEQNLERRSAGAPIDAMKILERYGVTGSKAVALWAELKALADQK